MAIGGAISPRYNPFERLIEAGEMHELADLGFSRPFSRPLHTQVSTQPLRLVVAGIEVHHKSVRHDEAVVIAWDLPQPDGVEAQAIPMPG